MKLLLAILGIMQGQVLVGIRYKTLEFHTPDNISVVYVMFFSTIRKEKKKKKCKWPAWRYLPRIFCGVLLSNNIIAHRRVTINASLLCLIYISSTDKTPVCVEIYLFYFNLVDCCRRYVIYYFLRLFIYLSIYFIYFCVFVYFIFYLFWPILFIYLRQFFI